MRAPSVLLRLALLVLALPIAFPDDGEDATRRAAELLASSTEVDRGACGVQLLGLYAQERLVGFMRSTLKPGADTKASDYAFSLEAELALDGSKRMAFRSAGRFAANLSPIEAEGEDRRSHGEQIASRSYAYRRADGGFAWTGAGQRPVAETRTIAGEADVVLGIDFLFARRWAALPAGTPYRFRALNGDKGRIEVIEISRGEARTTDVAGAAREVIDLKVVKLESKDAGDFVCDAMGRILAGKLAGSPYDLKAITPEQLEAWRGRPADGGSGSGS